MKGQPGALERVYKSATGTGPNKGRLFPGFCSVPFPGSRGQGPCAHAFGGVPFHGEKSWGNMSKRATTPEPSFPQQFVHNRHASMLHVMAVSGSVN
jgi:hypothetical protein